MDARYAFIGAIVGLLAIGLALLGAPVAVIGVASLGWGALLWLPAHALSRAVGRFPDDVAKG
jgi:hypothetical protein